MSSRGEFIGQGPSSGLYEVGNVPAKPEDLPMYLNDELLKISGHLGNSKAGEVFPVMSELPHRFKEGMTVFFTRALDVEEPVLGKYISSAGVYLYKKQVRDGELVGEPRWWKMIDDPSEAVGSIFVFSQLYGSKQDPAPTPPDSEAGVEPIGWTFGPPDKTDKSQWIYAAINDSFDPSSLIYTWTQSSVWSAGVEDGDDGKDGPEGFTSGARFLDSTGTPDVVDVLSKTPSTSSGRLWLDSIPEVSIENQNIYIITGLYRESATGMVEPGWSDPVLYATPEQATLGRAYTLTAVDDTPEYDRDAVGLPDQGTTLWSYDQPELPVDMLLWEIDRLEWGDHSALEPWGLPYIIGGLPGTTSGARYIASTSAPDIADTLVLDPVTSAGEPWLVDVPPILHPDKSFVWITTGSWLEGASEMKRPWSTPYKYSTPESTQVVSAYALTISQDLAPSFDPLAIGLPGPEWSYDQPTVGDKVLWTTTRLEWKSTHDKQSDWTPMFVASGKGGNPGAGFYRIGVLQSEFDDLPTLWSTATIKFTAHTGSAPYIDDVLTFYVSPVAEPAQSDTRRFDGTDWVAAELLIDGDIIASGTIVGDRLVAGTEIEAPVIHGGQITADVSMTAASILGGTISGSHFKGNGTTGDLALGGTNEVGTANAWIDANGNAEFKGDLNISGNATIDGDNLTVNGKISALTIETANITAANITAGNISGVDITGANLKGGTLAIGGTQVVGTANSWIDSNGNCSFGLPGTTVNIGGSGFVGGDMIINGTIFADNLSGVVVDTFSNHIVVGRAAGEETFRDLGTKTIPAVDYDRKVILSFFQATVDDDVGKFPGPEYISCRVRLNAGNYDNAIMCHLGVISQNSTGFSSSAAHPVTSVSPAVGGSYFYPKILEQEVRKTSWDLPANEAFDVNITRDYSSETTGPMFSIDKISYAFITLRVT